MDTQGVRTMLQEGQAVKENIAAMVKWFQNIVNSHNEGFNLKPQVEFIIFNSLSESMCIKIRAIMKVTVCERDDTPKIYSTPAERAKFVKIYKAIFEGGICYSGWNLMWSLGDYDYNRVSDSEIENRFPYIQICWDREDYSLDRGSLFEIWKTLVERNEKLQRAYEEWESIKKLKPFDFVDNIKAERRKMRCIVRDVKEFRLKEFDADFEKFKDQVVGFYGLVSYKVAMNKFQ